MKTVEKFLKTEISKHPKRVCPFGDCVGTARTILVRKNRELGKVNENKLKELKEKNEDL